MQCRCAALADSSDDDMVMRNTAAHLGFDQCREVGDGFPQALLLQVALLLWEGERRCVEPLVHVLPEGCRVALRSGGEHEFEARVQRRQAKPAGGRGDVEA